MIKWVSKNYKDEIKVAFKKKKNGDLYIYSKQEILDKKMDKALKEGMTEMQIRLFDTETLLKYLKPQRSLCIFSDKKTKNKSQRIKL